MILAARPGARGRRGAGIDRLTGDERSAFRRMPGELAWLPADEWPAERLRAIIAVGNLRA
jgi:hypothetical protein